MLNFVLIIFRRIFTLFFSNLVKLHTSIWSDVSHLDTNFPRPKETLENDLVLRVFFTCSSSNFVLINFQDKIFPSSQTLSNYTCRFGMMFLTYIQIFPGLKKPWKTTWFFSYFSYVSLRILYLSIFRAEFFLLLKPCQTIHVDLVWCFSLRYKFFQG